MSTRTPFIDTSAPAINAAPVELDGGVEVERKSAAGKDAEEKVVVSPGLGVEEEIEAEFLGEGGRGVGRVVMEVSFGRLFFYLGFDSMKGWRI